MRFTRRVAHLGLAAFLCLAAIGCGAGQHPNDRVWTYHQSDQTWSVPFVAPGAVTINLGGIFPSDMVRGSVEFHVCRASGFSMPLDIWLTPRTPVPQPFHLNAQQGICPDNPYGLPVSTPPFSFDVSTNTLTLTLSTPSIAGGSVTGEIVVTAWGWWGWEPR